MPTETIIIIFVGIMMFSGLLMIPTYLMMNKTKKKVKNFNEAHKDKAIIEIYQTKGRYLIDGISFQERKKENTAIKETGSHMIVALSAGTHEFSGSFETSIPSVTGKNKMLDIKKINFSLSLEAGQRYKVGIFFTPPVESSIFSLELDVIGKSFKAYVICDKMGV